MKNRLLSSFRSFKASLVPEKTLSRHKSLAFLKMFRTTNNRVAFVLALFSLLSACSQPVYSQTVYNAAYVKALYAKYPTKKHNLCPACKIWVNPYYTSIADTQRHMPICEKEVFTKANAALAEKLGIPRGLPKKGAPVKPGAMKYQSAFSNWSAVPGQPNEDNVYTAANKVVKAKNSKDEIAKGHVQAWVLNSFAIDAVILSDTYTFNAACEDQKQNVGTEINTENITRKLLLTTDVIVWGGTYDDTAAPNTPHTFTDGKVTDIYPTLYWKIIKPLNGQPEQCYLMPNNITQTEAMLPGCIKTHAELVARISFDPEKILP